MADIKTRDMVKGTIKTIDNAAVAVDCMRVAFVQTKEKAGEDSGTGMTMQTVVQEINTELQNKKSAWQFLPFLWQWPVTI